MRVIITGQMRSGTTLLANVLSSQPGLLVLADFLHIERLLTECRSGSLTAPLTPTQKALIISRFIGQPGSDGVRAIDEATGTKLQFETAPARFSTLLEFYDDIMAQVEAFGVEVPGHKTTCAEPVLEELLTLAPDVKCLYMLRDPRDVLLSNSRMMKQSPEVVLTNWKDGRREIRRLRALPAFHDRLLLVRYEDLVREPLATLEELARFLDRPPFTIPDEVRWYGTQFVANSSFGDIKQLFDPSGLGRWQTADPRLALTVEAMIADELHEAGYDSPRSIQIAGWMLGRLPRWMSGPLKFRPSAHAAGNPSAKAA